MDHGRERDRDHGYSCGAAVLGAASLWCALVARLATVTVDELLDEIRAFPFSVAAQEHGADADHVEDDVAAAIIEVAVAANLVRAAQESLKAQVDVARNQGAAWRAIAKAMAVSPWGAWRRRWETHPLDSWW